MTFHIQLVSVAAVLGMTACGSTSTAPAATSSAPHSQTDLRVGTGAEATAGRRVIVAYTGWLYDSSASEGKGRQIDSNANFGFLLGVGQVIAGWDRGVVGMRVGGLRRLVIPSELAYGSAGAGGGRIPPNATLVFDITLNDVQ
jgi:FKBP-type peptidyl-prolyl cis-trans isomerase FkpA